MKKTKSGRGINSMPAGTRIVTHICLVWALVVSLVPLGWLVLSSLKKDPMARPGFQLPETICLDGYISTFRDLHVLRYFGNSLFVAGVSVMISVVMISMSAYVVARMEFKGKAGKYFIIFYHVYSCYSSYLSGLQPGKPPDLYDTRSALILIYSCSGIAVSFFVIKNYYDNIPRELEEAARIDGCGYVQTWVNVIFPIARPGIMTAAVLAFLNNWNEYYWASSVISRITREKLTVPALLSTLAPGF